MKTNKTAFTLIELLAVIIILGIIALIAVPVINNLLKEARIGAFNTTIKNITRKVDESCQIDNMKGKEFKSIYTLIDGEFDYPIDFNGNMPINGYVLVKGECEIAYTFYDESYTISKNFDEKEGYIYTNNKAPIYGIKWVSNKETLEDTFTRTYDSKVIKTSEVNVQKGDTPVENVFDSLDIYKDILPITDKYGNEFMLIPKFYIKKTKKETDTEITWDYAISKYKVNKDYYLPACFVDEGIGNDKYIELPYVLVAKYSAGSNGLSGDNERLVSKSGILPKTNISMYNAKDYVERYNVNDVGYQLYDIHIHDLLTVLFSIEFNTVNAQSILSGFVGEDYSNGPFITGGSDDVKSSVGTLNDDSVHAFTYRGIENLWGGVLTFTDGVVFHNNIGSATEHIDKINNIYISRNSRHYTIGEINDYYNLLGYKKISFDTDLNDYKGWVKDYNFDPSVPFITLPSKLTDNSESGTGDYFDNFNNNGYQILTVGGSYVSSKGAGLFNYYTSWSSGMRYPTVGARLAKIAITN